MASAVGVNSMQPGVQALARIGRRHRGRFDLPASGLAPRTAVPAVRAGLLGAIQFERRWAG